jgi:hypothetical protein
VEIGPPTLAGIFALAGLALLVQSNTIPYASTTSRPILEVLPQSQIAIGDIKQGDTREFECTVRNNSKSESIDVRLVPQSSCSCLKIVSATNIRLEPLSEKPVKLRYSPTIERGEIRKAIFVLGVLSSIDLPRSTISIKADVTDEYHLSENYLSFGQNDNSKTIQLIDGFSDLVAIKEATSYHKGISTVISPNGKSLSVTINRTELVDVNSSSAKELRVLTTSDLNPEARIDIYVETNSN